MSEKALHSRSFPVLYDDVDSLAFAKPVSLLHYLEEAAASHCEDSGWGVFRLLSEGHGWVLLRGGFEMRRYPAYRENVTVETWVSSSRRFCAEREYRVLSASSEVLGEARALWLFCDLGTRRPATIFPEILEAWAPNGKCAGSLALDEIDGPPADAAAPLDVVAPGGGFAVRAGDIDTNGHVNNAIYLSWALEALPREAREGMMLRKVRGQWKKEITFGLKVQPRAASEGDGRYRLGIYGAGPAGPAGAGGAGVAAAGAGDRAGAGRGPEREGAAVAAPWLAAAAESEWTPMPAAKR